MQYVEGLAEMDGLENAGNVVEDLAHSLAAVSIVEVNDVKRETRGMHIRT